MFVKTSDTASRLIKCGRLETAKLPPSHRGEGEAHLQHGLYVHVPAFLQLQYSSLGAERQGRALTPCPSPASGRGVSRRAYLSRPVTSTAKLPSPHGERGRG